MSIDVEDINDNAPSFQLSTTTVTISESAVKDSVVARVVATDADVASNAKVTFSLKLQDRQHFYVTSEEVADGDEDGDDSDVDDDYYVIGGGDDDDGKKEEAVKQEVVKSVAVIRLFKVLPTSFNF